MACGSMHPEGVLIVLHRFSRRAEDKTQDGTGHAYLTSYRFSSATWRNTSSENA